MQELLHGSRLPSLPPGGMRLEASEKRSSRERKAAGAGGTAQPVLGLTAFSIPVQMVLSVSLGLKASWEN